MAKEIPAGTGTAGTPANIDPSSVLRLPGLNKRKQPKVHRGRDFFDNEAVRIMLFGDQGSGKSYCEVPILQGGYRVVRVECDAGSRGEDETVLNHLRDTPELLENEIVVAPETPAEFEAFMEDPTIAIPDLYDWDPDFLILNGYTNFQSKIEYEEFDRCDDSPQQTWGKIGKRTVEPLLKFLQLHNKVTGRNWSKIVTVLETDKPTEWNPTMDGKGNLQQKPVISSYRVGPMLSTRARSLARGGFGLVLQTKRRQIGSSKATFYYVTDGTDELMVKNRGYGLDREVDPLKFWKETIFPRIPKPRREHHED